MDDLPLFPLTNGFLLFLPTTVVFKTKCFCATGPVQPGIAEIPFCEIKRG